MATPLPVESSGSVRVLLVEDHELVWQAISLVFEELPDIDLVAQATLAREGVASARQHQPDVVLLDCRLPDGDPVNAIELFHEASPASRVLVLTGYVDARSSPELLRRGRRAGAQGVAGGRACDHDPAGRHRRARLPFKRGLRDLQ